MILDNFPELKDKMDDTMGDILKLFSNEEAVTEKETL